MYSRLVYSCLPSTRLWLGQRIVKVVGDVFVELFVLFIGDFRLVTSPQRLRFVDFLPEITVSPSFSSRFSISTGSAIWSEYLLMMERTRQSSRNSSSPSRRCRVISVPRSSLVMSATVYSPSPADSQKTPFSGFRLPREYARSLCQPR